MNTDLAQWDTAANLTTAKHVAAYLQAAFDDGDPALVSLALGNVAQAPALAEIAASAGVSRDTLYKALTEQGDPRLTTFIGVMKALGLKIVAEPA